MKPVKALLAAAIAFASVGASASTPAEIYERGSKLIDKFQADEQMDYLLNPIICENRKGEIVLIFSDDFRHKEQAYLIDGDLVMKAKTSKLGLVRGKARNAGEYSFEVVMYKDADLVCAYSNMVLEMPGR